jgi:hypothetical protein
MSNPITIPDPVIDEVRAIRHRISAQFGHDPRKLVGHYMELQARHSDRLIGRSKAEPGAGESAA